MPKVKRSLYQCFNAKCRPKEIFCSEGHPLGNISGGTLPIEKLAQGEALELSCCQSCGDYDEMGPPVPLPQRGWDKAKDEITQRPAGTFLVTELVLNPRTLNVLRRNKIYNVKDILLRSPDELMNLRNFGKASLQDLIQALADEGIKYPE